MDIETAIDAAIDLSDILRTLSTYGQDLPDRNGFIKEDIWKQQ